MKPEPQKLKDKVSSIPNKTMNKEKPEVGTPQTKYDKVIQTNEGTIEKNTEKQAP